MTSPPSIIIDKAEGSKVLVELVWREMLLTKNSKVGLAAVEFAVKVIASPVQISLLKLLEVIPTVGVGSTKTVMIAESSKQEDPVAVSYTRTTTVLLLTSVPVAFAVKLKVLTVDLAPTLAPLTKNS